MSSAYWCALCSYESGKKVDTHMVSWSDVPPEAPPVIDFDHIRVHHIQLFDESCAGFLLSKANQRSWKPRSSLIQEALQHLKHLRDEALFSPSVRGIFFRKGTSGNHDDLFFWAETTTVKLSFTSNGNRAVGFLDKITRTCCTIGNQEASAVHVEKSWAEIFGEKFL